MKSKQVELLLAAMIMATTLGVTLPVQANPAEDVFWRSVQKGNVVEEYELYLRQYPGGRYVAEARKRISELRENDMVRNSEAKREVSRREEEAKQAAIEAERREQESKESVAIAKVCSSSDELVALAFDENKKEELKKKSNELNIRIRSNDDEILGLIRKAANRGNAEAQSCFGVIQLEVARDGNGALYWIQKAAGQGNSRGQAILGVAYITGKGVAKDYAEGIGLIRKAVDQGNAHAEVALAACYVAGECGLSKDIPEGVRLLKKAAEQGHGFAKALVEKINRN